jgi:hypothetical protein
MKKINSYLIAILLITGISSCTDDSKNQDQKENLTTTTTEDTPESSKVKKHTINSDCKAYFEAIDFSSFCFSNNKTPKFEVGSNYGISSRCQFRVYSDEDNFDFLLLISTSTENLEKIKTIYDANKKSLKLMGYGEINDLNDLGDYAYIAYSEDNKTKEIHVISGNATIKVELSDTDESCLYQDSELKELAKFILATL